MVYGVFEFVSDVGRFEVEVEKRMKKAEKQGWLNFVQARTSSSPSLCLDADST